MDQKEIMRYEPYEVRIIGFDLDCRNSEAARITQQKINEELFILRQNFRVPCYMKLITDLNGNIKFYYIYHKDSNIPSKNKLAEDFLT